MEPERVTIPSPGEGKGAEIVARLPGGERLAPRQRAAVALGAAVLLLILAFAVETWGFMALGTVVGVLYVVGASSVRAALQPVVALAAAALPLLMPLLVFVAAGAVRSPPALQFVIGLLTLLLAALFGWPDRDRIKEAFKRQPRYRSFLRGLAQVAVPLLIALIALIFVFSAIVGALSDSDQTARSFFVVAAGFLACAAVLRTVGYARTVFRGAVALALLVLLAKLAAEVGLLSGALVEGDWIPTVALVAGALLGLAVLVEFVTALLARDAQQGLSDRVRAAAFLETPVAARWVTDRLSVLGLACAGASSVLLLAAAIAANTAGGAKEDVGDAPRGGQPQTPPAQMSDRALAEAYSPVLLFTADQRWTPTTVDAYVSGATVRDWEGRRRTVQGVGQLPTACPGVVREPCFVMEQHCPKDADEAQCAEDLPDEKAVYVRVARRQQWAGTKARPCGYGENCADGSPDPFARAKGPYAAQTEILVQYWLFYPYNEWVAPVALGDLKEIHAADWEAVTVGLSADRPLWVAYSAHCAGSFAAWSDVRVSPADPARLHPLVAVAEGSQANYRVAKQSRVPNFAECSGITHDRLQLLSYAANVRDRTDDAKPPWSPAAGDLRLVDARTPPMSFPGTWARSARMRLDNLHESLKVGKETPGPASPPLQPLWQKPMNAIFGGGPWVRG